MDNNVDDILYWGIREIKVGKRLPYFSYSVWAIIAILAISFGIGLAIGVDSNSVLHEAIVRSR